MTRINAGFDPEELPRQALLSEHREIVRIPNAVRSGRVNLTDLPPKFTLGTGHVRFFYDKLKYLSDRYEYLYVECVLRGYNVGYMGGAFAGARLAAPALWGTWEATPEARRIVEQRLIERGHINPR